MQFIEDGKIVNYNLDRKNYLNQGDSTSVYVIEKKVIKLFKHSSSKSSLSKELCDKLTNINTKRILLPKTTLLGKEDKELKAYSMDYIRDYGMRDFLLLPKDKLVKEMKLIKKDIGILSDERILINDLYNTDNISFHNGIYLIDPGSYTIIKDENGSRTYAYNLEEINNLLINIFELSLKQNCKGKNKVPLILRSIKENIYQKKLNPLDFLIEEFNDVNILSFIEKNIKEYKKEKNKTLNSNSRL